MIVIGAVILVAALLGGGWEYWSNWRFDLSTDDAYVHADIVAVAPEVSGYLVSVHVGDNQHVKAGDVLAVIDPQRYEWAVQEAEASVAHAQASIDEIRARLAVQPVLIEEARASMDVSAAALAYAEENMRRYGTLATEGYGAEQIAQQSQSQLRQAEGRVLFDKAALRAAEQRIRTLEAELAGAEAGLARSKAALGVARYNLERTVLRAPIDGVVGDRKLRVGLFVQPGARLLSLVPLQATYVIANYKETDLAGVMPGQPVSIAVDMFPDVTVRGFVNSMSPAAGQIFALLPPNNATGNFTKIVQRVPVKILVDPTDPLAGRLRPGLSVTTTILTRTDERLTQAGHAPVTEPRP